MTHPLASRPLATVRRLASLLVALTVLSSPAAARKIPVLIDVGVGPAVWTGLGDLDAERVLHPGVVLRVDAVVTRKQLKKKWVRKRIPQRYRGETLLRHLPDLHVRQGWMMGAPDAFVLSPNVRGASWAPLSLKLLHHARPAHTSLNIQPRITLLGAEGAGGPTASLAHVGLAANPDVYWKVAKRVWVGGGWESSIGLPIGVVSGASSVRMFHVGRAYGMLHVRIPVKIHL
jgi:hypothetical protein